MLALPLHRQSDWLFLGRPSFEIEGSQFAVPRAKRGLPRDRLGRFPASTMRKTASSNKHSPRR